MQKQLIIGDDYGTIFGLDPKKGQHIVYLGGVRFRLAQGVREAERESQDTYEKILEYINQPSIHMGRM